MMSPSIFSRPFKDTLADDAYAHDVMRASVDHYAAFSSIISLVSRHSSIVDAFSCHFLLSKGVSISFDTRVTTLA
jgi:hypothetical protein